MPDFPPTRPPGPGAPSARLPVELSPRRLGLTGSIGAGKSTVAALLRDRGLVVLDADAVARELGRSPQVLAEVERRLGPQYVQRLPSGEAVGLDRPALAALVFADAQKREVLNGILHPRVRARMAELERQAVEKGAAWVVQDVPLLFEGEAWKNMDAVLLVDAPLEVRLERVMARDGLTREAVLARDAAQMPIAQKRALLDQLPGRVLDNGGTELQLAEQVGAALEQLGVIG
jgi:dephospho-CoA kinase